MQEQFVSALESMKLFLHQVVVVLPGLMVAVALLIVGWLTARFIRKLLIRLMKLFRLDILAERTGIEDFLLQGGVKYTAVTLVASVVYWLILFTVILAALTSLGLQTATDLVQRIVLFIPNVVVATLVLMFGGLFAKFVRGLMYTYLNNIGVTGADIISNIGQIAILLFVVFVALEQLSIGGQILISGFQIAFGALCLALALAFGLGGKEWAAHLLERMWKRDR
jgi:hypothetical protein